MFVLGIKCEPERVQIEWKYLSPGESGHGVLDAEASEDTAEEDAVDEGADEEVVGLNIVIAEDDVEPQLDECGYDEGDLHEGR